MKWKLIIGLLLFVGAIVAVAIYMTQPNQPKHQQQTEEISNQYK